MSVLIEDMEIPDNCYACPFVRTSWGNNYYCAKGSGTEDNIRVLMRHRMDDCPLVEVPTPHGRLGDLDELVKTLEQNRLCYVLDIDDESFELGINKAINIVRNANTIIEAREKND